MNPMTDRLLEPEAAAGGPAAPEDPRVVAALEEYLAALEAGAAPDRDAFLARHPGLAPALAECLDGLDFLRTAAPRLRDPERERPAGHIPPAADIQPEVPLGDYRLVREVGRGGMGVVYEAVQLSLGRRVALKVLPFASALDARQLRRFQNEAQAAAQLHHTHIVPVFGVGCERGVHYYAMQFIDGQTLAALIDQLRAPGGRDRGRVPGPGGGTDSELTSLYSRAPETAPRGAAETPGRTPSRDPAFFRTVAGWGIQAALALEHAHQLGVVHRDVKPANLLLDDRGSLWVTDFGLALCQNREGLTLSGDLVGTLRYMSPEQALGRRGGVDHRTDLYSLGATLYELLTLGHASPGSDRHEILRQIAFEEPRPPRRVNGAVPAELETIVLKALEKNPADRYATAQELADDLQRFLNDEPIRARPATLLHRARKWARRHRPVVYAALASAVLLVAAGVAAFAVSHVRIQEALRDEIRARRELAAALGREKQGAYFHRVDLASHYWRANDVGRAEQLLGECPPALRGWEWNYLRRLCRAELLTFRGHSGRVNDVTFSPDGTRLASSGDAVRVWDAATGAELLRLPGHTGVSFHPNGRHLAFGEANCVRVCDVTTGKEVRRLEGHAGRVVTVEYRPDGRRLASAALDGTLKVWDAATGRELLTLRGHAGPVVGVAFSPDGSRLASAGRDRTVGVWDATTGQKLLTLGGHRGRVDSVAFSPDGKHLASAGWDRTVKVWEATTGREVLTLPGHDWNMVHLPVGIHSVRFSPDGRRLAVAGWDRAVKVYDAGTGGEVLTWRGHAHVVRSVAFSPDGRRLASAGEDGTVRLWPALPRDAFALPAGSVPVRWMAFSPDGRRLAWGDHRDVVVRAVGGRAKALVLRGHRRPVFDAVFQEGGRRLVSVSAGGTVKLWDADAGREVKTIPGFPPDLRSAAFSPGGRRLALVTSQDEVQVWDVAKTRPLTVVGPGPDRAGINRVVFRPDGKAFALASGTLVRVYDISGRVLGTLRGHRGEVISLAFHPDGRHLASASLDHTIRTWDLATGREVRQLLGYTWPVESWPNDFHGLAFSPDGRRLVAAAEEHLKVWDTATGQEILTLVGHAQNITCLAFSPDGRRLASVSWDRVLRIWDGRPPDEGPRPGPGE